jgi:hypothetical protein
MGDEPAATHAAHAATPHRRGASRTPS